MTELDIISAFKAAADAAVVNVDALYPQFDTGIPEDKIEKCTRVSKAFATSLKDHADKIGQYGEDEALVVLPDMMVLKPVFEWMLDDTMPDEALYCPKEKQAQLAVFLSATYANLSKILVVANKRQDFESAAHYAMGMQVVTQIGGMLSLDPVALKTLKSAPKRNFQIH